MFVFTPQPPQELLEDLPEGVSIESAVIAWYEGLNDGYAKKEYRIFKEDLGIQDIYSNGYERGEKNREVATEIEQGRKQEPQPPPLQTTAQPQETAETPPETPEPQGEVHEHILNPSTFLEMVLGGSCEEPQELTALEKVAVDLEYYQGAAKTACYGAVALLALKLLLSERL